MDIGVIFFIIMACLVCAAVVYVTMEFRIHGERADGSTKLLKAQGEVLAVRKDLAGYTKHPEYVTAAKAMVVEKAPTMVAKMVREYAHMENFVKDPAAHKTVVSILVRYTGEYTFGFDLRDDKFALLSMPEGIEVQLAKPSLQGVPVIKVQSHEVAVEGAIPEEKTVLEELYKKIPGIAQARKHSAIMACEEAAFAICEKKLLNALREFFTAQPGVIHVPSIKLTYK